MEETISQNNETIEPIPEQTRSVFSSLSSLPYDPDLIAAFELALKIYKNKEPKKILTVHGTPQKEKVVELHPFLNEYSDYSVIYTEGDEDSQNLLKSFGHVIGDFAASGELLPSKPFSLESLEEIQKHGRNRWRYKRKNN